MGSFSNNDEYGSQKRHLLLFYYLFFWFIFYELSSDYSIRGQIGNAEVMVCITYICLNCQMERKPLRFSHFYDPKKGRAFRNIGKNHYIPNCKTSICTNRLIFGIPG